MTPNSLGSLDLRTHDATTVIKASSPVSGAAKSRSLRWQNTSDIGVTGQLIRLQAGGCTSCTVVDAYSIRLYETTYRAARFNNGGTQSTVLFVQNRRDYAVAGAIHFWDAAGNLLASQPLSVSAKATQVVATTSIPALVGVSGAITVSHDGGYGALSGKAVGIDPADAGFTFDTLLEPVPQ